MNLKNKVQLIGNIGNEPELKDVSGTPLLNFTMATNESYKNKAGEKVQETTWHNIEVWGKLAEIINKYFSKGSEIAVEGKIKTQTWEKDGQKQYKTIIKVHDFEFMGSKSNNTTSDAADNYDTSNSVLNENDPLPF